MDTHFFRIKLLQLQLRNYAMFFHENICFRLYIDKTCVWDVFYPSENPLKMDTRLIRTLWYALSVRCRYQPGSTVYNCMKIGPQTDLKVGIPVKL